MQEEYKIRNARPEEYGKVGELMVNVYSQLAGFPSPQEQPEYYRLLANVGEMTKKPGTELIVVVAANDQVVGAVVFFNDIQYYGSGGTATMEKDTAGFRLLAVDPSIRGKGIGKLLTNECIRRTREQSIRQLIIHTTMAMQTAWKMYEGIGFRRSEDLDFMQGELPVYGFRLQL